MADDDVFKMLKDLELKAVNLDPQTQKMQEGYFMALRSVGLPLPPEDFANPYTPSGSMLGNIDNHPNHDQSQDPKTTKDKPQTVSGQLDMDTSVAAVAKTFQSFVNTFVLTDEKLQMNSQFSVQPGATRISDSWWAIVNGATVNPIEPTVSDDVKKALAKAMAVLVDPTTGDLTPHFQTYRQLQKDYEAAVRKLNRAYADAFTDPVKLAQWGTSGVTYQDDVDQALQDWESMGYRTEIETAQDILSAQGIDPAIALIAHAKGRFQASLVNIPGLGGNVPYVSLVPPSWYDPDQDDGWTTYGRTDFNTHNNYTASSTSYGGGGGLTLGLWSASASLDHAESKKSMNIDTHNVQVQFDYCVVDVFRAGVDTSLLNLHNWFIMGPGYHPGCISTGKMAQEFPNENEPVFLPSLVTSLLLIRNLKLTWSSASEASTAHDAITNAGGSVGWGPFAISGHYSHHGNDGTFDMQLDGETLTVRGTQLIGYISAINPPSPALDSDKFMTK